MFDLDYLLSLCNIENRSENEVSGQADLEAMPAKKWLSEKRCRTLFEHYRFLSLKNKQNTGYSGIFAADSPNI